MKLALITAPVVVYSPTLPAPGVWMPPSPTKRVLPDNASVVGAFSPVMMLGLLGLTGAPVVALYAPTVPTTLFTTKRVLPDNASSTGSFSPVMKLALITAPVVDLYSP